MKKTVLSLALVFVILTSALAQLPQGNAVPPAPQQRPAPKTYQYETIENIRYRNSNDPAYLNERCMLDIYYPTDKNRLPILQDKILPSISWLQ